MACSCSPVFLGILTLILRTFLGHNISNIVCRFIFPCFHYSCGKRKYKPWAIIHLSEYLIYFQSAQNNIYALFFRIAPTSEFLAQESSRFLVQNWDFVVYLLCFRSHFMPVVLKEQNIFVVQVQKFKMADSRFMDEGFYFFCAVSWKWAKQKTERNTLTQQSRGGGVKGLFLDNFRNIIWGFRKSGCFLHRQLLDLWLKTTFLWGRGGGIKEC